MKSAGERGEQTVLIVDDDPDIRASIRNVLAATGVAVLGEARDGEDAIRLARKLRPAVVLMDLVMPHMNGLEALRRTKRELPGIKVVVITTHEEDVYRKVALAGGADAYIVKKQLSRELLPTLRLIT